MVDPQKTSRLARFTKYTLTLLACIAFTLQISSHIISFRVVLRTPTRHLQLGTSGGNLCAVYTSFPKVEVIDSAIRVWWDSIGADSHNFFSCNFTPPHLTPADYINIKSEPSGDVPIDPNIVLTNWKTAGFHRVVQEIVPGDFRNDKVPQSLTELDTWWLTPLWLLPLLATVWRRHRNHTLHATFRNLRRIAFTTAAGASLLLAVIVAIFWVRGLSRAESLALVHYFSLSPFECRTYFARSGPAYFGLGVDTQVDGPTTTGWKYRSLTPRPLGKPIVHSAFDLKLHPLELRSPFFEFMYHHGDYAVIDFRPWLLQILTLIAPITWLVLRLRKKPNLPADHPLCPNCSYDLHAHHPGDRCPECGNLIPAASG